MRIKRRKVKTIQFRDNYNFTLLDSNEELLIVDRGIYRFVDKLTHLNYMMIGITTGAERRVEGKKINIYYNNRLMTEKQQKFLRERARQLGLANPNLQYKGCGCVKNKTRQ